MTKQVCIAAGFVASLFLGTAQAQDAAATVKNSGCLKCHSVSAEKDGPSYKSVAAKYKGQADAQAKLEKFIAGHQGGTKPKDQAKNVAAYILSR